MAAVAISGAVVVRQVGKEYSYRQKCDSCGWVDSITRSASEDNFGGYLSSTTFCSKCHKASDMRIEHTATEA
jgi:hypothetical protein